MSPVLGWKIVEGEEVVPVLLQTRHRGRALRAEGLDEEGTHSLRGGSYRGHPVRVQRRGRLRLHALRQLIQSIGRFVHPTPLRSRRREHLGHGRPEAQRAVALREAGVEGRFNVVFAGTMGRAQALSSVLHAARIVAAQAPRVQFVFVGGGTEVARLKAEATEMALPNVRFLPVRPAVEVGPLLAAADVLLVHLRDDPLFSITIPSKTQVYMAAGRPVLMAVGGDAAALVAGAEAGVSVNPDGRDALATAVCDLSCVAPASLAGMGARGLAYDQKHLSLAVGADAFEALFRQAVQAA